MLNSVVPWLVRRIAPLAMGATAIGTALAGNPAVNSATTSALARPAVSEATFIASGQVPPPNQAACAAVNRRCFSPEAIANAYNYAVLHDSNHMGQGKTIAVVDSFGASTIRQDLGWFNHSFGLPHLCGETGPNDPSGNCPSTTSPRFDIIQIQGGPPPVPPPANNTIHGTALENHNLWDIEVALDVEWAHATAPLANIMLVETPTAETLGVQGFQQMMNAEQELIDSGRVDVISQSFGSGEGAFNGGTAAIKQLRQAFIDAQARHVTVFASSGDGGTTNAMKTPVKTPTNIPYPSVIWPASDPLVTAVGGTYLCVDPATGTVVDSVSPPTTSCGVFAGVREPSWVDSGGGYSTVFSRPSWQTFPAGSTYVGSSAGAPGPNTNMRGIPDIAYNASSRTGVLVYLTEPAGAPSPPGTVCGGANPCSTGWYTVGGTSAGSPQWAGLIALADQMAGRDLGFISPALYQLADVPATYAKDFYDVTTGFCNQTSSIPGYCASTGWDAVTGLGTPNAAELLPDLIAATP